MNRLTLTGAAVLSLAALAARADETTAPTGLPSCCTIPSRFAAMATPRVAIEPTEAGLQVLLSGEPFAEYRTNNAHQPVVWPIYGPSGEAMTRSYPLGPLQPNESKDHPHHQSFWFAHGDVNSHDFWHHPGSRRDGQPRILHKEFRRQEVVNGIAVIETTNDWLAEGEPVLSDRRELRFGTLWADDKQPAARYIDFTIELIASHGPVVFGDTKEGTFAVRVPGPMKVHAKLGAQIRNDLGQINQEAWGRSARWVAYSGPLTGAADGDEAAPIGGIVMMSHPDNDRPQCRWHARTYGFLAANPFGQKDFPAGPPQQGAVTIPSGSSLKIRYATVFHSGTATPQDIARWYNGILGSAVSLSDTE